MEDAEIKEDFSEEGETSGEELCTEKQYWTARDGEVDNLRREVCDKEFAKLFRKQGGDKYLDAKRSMPQVFFLLTLD